ncbi:MAG: glycosyltransferase family 1 protein [Prolixibacteraceae bacterium]|nr:glycosyltransferase family 1 protein [Prolixibacteraceae bacterium]
MKIAIDCKNQALYGGGISNWASEVLPEWVAACINDEVTLITPSGNGVKSVIMTGTKTASVPWPTQLPLHLQHAIYDNLLFPLALSKIQPDLVFSPYHDIRMPRGITSVITVHDLCYYDVPQCYPWYLRAYRLGLLRANVARAQHIITVSNYSRERLMKVLSLPKDRISVVPNSLSNQFLLAPPAQAIITTWRQDHGDAYRSNSLLLYSGGIEPRKNLPGLIAALRLLWENGEKITLLVTGQLDQRWDLLLPEHKNYPERIRFLGRLTLEQLRLAYEAVDAVVYPTMCEGFGRVCLEAMACGTPLACSNLEVFREVAGDYPHYFSPLNIHDMAKAISAASGSGRQVRYQDERFTSDATRHAFLNAMMPIIEKMRNRST